MKLYKTHIIACVIGLIIGYSYAFLKKPDVKIVTKLQERVKTVTRIVKNKDGSSITIIDQDRNTKLDQTVSPSKKDWHVAIGQSLNESVPVYHVSVDRRILGDFSIGGYINSDKEVGFRVSFSF